MASLAAVALAPASCGSEPPRARQFVLDPESGGITAEVRMECSVAGVPGVVDDVLVVPDDKGVLALTAAGQDLWYLDYSTTPNLRAPEATAGVLLLGVA